MQDNLEFLQWTKRYWDQYFPGHDYDAIGRRKGSAGASTASASVGGAGRTSTVGAGARKPANTGAPRVAAGRVGSAAGGAAIGGGAGASAALRQENEALKQDVEDMEKQRDFYFGKLRNVELLLQAAIEQDPEIEKDENGLVRSIQEILYSTEEGFDIPAEADDGANGGEPDTF